jgi:hypothetical protein
LSKQADKYRGGVAPSDEIGQSEKTRQTNDGIRFLVTASELRDRKINRRSEHEKSESAQRRKRVKSYRIIP